MRTDAIFRKDFRFDRYKLVYEEVGEQTQRRWDPAEEEIPAMILPQGNSILLFCDQRLEMGDQVHNLTDASGTNVFEIGDTPLFKYVTGVTPGFNPYGIIIGWRHQLGDEVPRTFQQIVSEFGA